jgi:predicted nuclease of predicted toxin-antitoxin system
VRFLVDAQLPPDLARFLTSCGYEAKHVEEIGLLSADDSEIWERARSDGFIIVTKDADFAALSNLRTGPQILWLRFNAGADQGALSGGPRGRRHHAEGGRAHRRGADMPVQTSKALRSRRGCIRRRAARGWNCARATCCWRRWSPAPA